MAPKRPHKKSRTGCRTCRNRRVKCDEVQPVCSNCSSRQVVCVWDDYKTVTVTSRHAHRRSYSWVYSPTPGCQTSSSNSPQILFTDTLSLGPAAHPTSLPSSTFDLSGLELLHHYTVYTYATICADERVDNIFKVSVPQMALRHDCILRVMFAISALHLSYIKDDHGAAAESRYRELAAAHLHAAITTLRSQILAHSADHANAVYVCSSLLCIIVIAFPFNGHRSVEESRILSWLPYVKGIKTILQHYWKWIMDGELSVLLHRAQQTRSHACGTIQARQIAFANQVRTNLNRLLTDTEAPDQYEIQHGRTLDIYRLSVTRLQESWDQMNQRELCLMSIFSWLTSLEEDFVDLINDKRPRALVILAYYCALLKQFEGHWWIRGVAETEFRIIEKVLREEWRTAVEWPKRIISG
ncbi:hypothetical protein V1517DRAFT_327541 [Lipomyces orientalis]|uniref:Uncharacterized protein n=1 Tax=Lipomyces orientalis TaxID=1233043 RepID=A0ACC3TJK2_9ASCO